MMRSIVIILVLLISNFSLAEPYFAVREGMHCRSCHVNPTGGGMRNAFGNAYAQNQLAVSTLALPNDAPWTGALAGPVSIGGNGRYSFRQFDIDNIDTPSTFATDRVSLYVSAALNDSITLMVDQQVGPGGSLNRESWIKLQSGNWFVKAGKIFQPFGWRLEDDGAFIRQETGINFNAGDNGVELGFEKGAWSTQFAITNGSGGGTDNDDGKQASFRLAQAQQNFQWGINANINNLDAGERTIAGLFVGLNTGPITWLGEVNQIRNRDFATNNGDQDLAFLEANILISKGHNLKVTAEAHQFDNNTEDRMRYSLVYEFFPISFSQLRIGLRERDSDDIDPVFSAQELFAQMHVYF